MVFETLEAAVDWLNDLHNPVRHSNNDKVMAALEFLGNPERDLPIIHITGTNGKGSVAAYLRDLLLSQGLSVGTFTSPHIMRINERITFNGEEISDEDLKDLIEQMVLVNDYLATTQHGHLVYFENYTVMMALYFKAKQPDVIVCEVGVGGYKDATNVMDAKVAVVTTIGLDHADKLGDTIEEVAYQKSGIIKKHAKVVTGRIEASTIAVLEEKAREESAQIYRFQEDYAYNNLVSLGEAGSDFDYHLKWQGGDIQESWHTRMLGQYQVDNASVAITAFHLWMQIHSLSIDLPAAQTALAQTQWIARMEKIYEQPTIYIDGAHNKEGLTALKQMVDDSFADQKIIVLYSGLATKNQKQQLKLLHKFKAEALYLSTFGHFEAMTLADFDRVAQEVGLTDQDYQLLEDWQGLLEDFIQANPKDYILLVTGSLYFVSDVRQYISQI